MKRISIVLTQCRLTSLDLFSVQLVLCVATLALTVRAEEKADRMGAVDYADAMDAMEYGAETKYKPLLLVPRSVILSFS